MPAAVGAVRVTERLADCPGNTWLVSGTGPALPIIVPPTNIIESTVVPGPQAQLPSFRSFQVLTKLVPGGMTVLSGMVTSAR